MRHELTAAAQRILDAATHCEAEITPAAILHSILAEPECRAALLLANYGITPRSAAASFPPLPLGEGQGAGNLAQQIQPAFAPSLSAGIAAAQEKLAELPTSAIATEHLLIALLEAAGDVAQWLTAQGMATDDLVAAIYQAYGITPGPLELEDNSLLPSPNTFAPGSISPESSAGSNAISSSKDSRSARSLPPDKLAAIRILDAAANRAGEGLRVVEDYVRFVLDDRRLTELCKLVRHELTASLSFLSPALRLSARDTAGDVGTSVSTSSEFHRTSAADVATASFHRLKESLRSLEEYAKLFDSSAAQKLEALRYRIYTLEQAVFAANSTRGATGVSPVPNVPSNSEHQISSNNFLHRLERIRAAKLYVLLDGRASLDEFAQLATELISAGVHVLQLREKQLDDRTLLARAKTLRDITYDTPTLFVMNDRPDLARLADADGVHVGQEELAVSDVRTIVGPEMLIGVSTHHVEQARQAVRDGANYLGIGPTFPSLTKSFESFPGLDFVREIAGELTLPAFAIGGITLENLPQVQAAGLSRVAVSGAILGADSPAEAARKFLRQLGE